MSWKSEADEQRCGGGSLLPPSGSRALRITAVSAATNVHRSATMWQSTLTLPNVEKVSNVPRQRILDLVEEVNAPVGRQRRGLTATAHECISRCTGFGLVDAN